MALLIIDDFGLKPLRSPQDEDVHDLISERYEQRATIVTSNLDFSEWGDAFPNRLLGAATLDRLRHNTPTAWSSMGPVIAPRNHSRNRPIHPLQIWLKPPNNSPSSRSL